MENNFSYLGTINIGENSDIIVFITRDDTKPNILKFVDEYNNLLAIDLGNEMGILPSQQLSENPELFETIKQQIQDLLRYKINSIKNAGKTHKQVAGKLGIPKEKIKAIHETVEEEEKDDKDKVKIKDDEKENEDSAQDTEAKIAAKTKQQTSLDQRINDNLTLREALNLPADAQTLVAVESDSVENAKNSNNTRFSFLYKDNKGQLHEINGLEMAEGNTPGKKVGVSNETGDNLETTTVNSKYSITRPDGRKYVLTAKISTYGVIDLGFGEIPRNQGVNEVEPSITVPLKTNSTYYTNRETREALVGNKNGINKAEERSEEYEPHIDCEKPHTYENADGNPHTGIEGKIEQLWEQEGDTLGEFCNEGDLKRHFEENPQIIEGIDINDSQQRKAIVIYLESEFGLSKGPMGRRR